MIAFCLGVVLVLFITPFAWMIWELIHAPEGPFWWDMDLQEFERWLAAGQPPEAEWKGKP